MEIEKDEKKDVFGLKEHDGVFVAAMKLVTVQAALCRDRDRTVDGMVIEYRNTKRRFWQRKKVLGVLSIIIREGRRVVFDASSQLMNGSKKNRGWVRTFHEGLWILRLMRAARIQDYQMSVSAEVYRKAVGLLSEQTEATEPLASEVQYSPIEVVHRVFESAQIEVRGYKLYGNDQKKKDRFKAVRVVHEGKEVYEAVYAHDPLVAQLPDSPKLTSLLVFGDWQKTLQDLGVEQGGQQ